MSSFTALIYTPKTVCSHFFSSLWTEHIYTLLPSFIWPCGIVSEQCIGACRRLYLNSHFEPVITFETPCSCRIIWTILRFVHNRIFSVENIQYFPLATVSKPVSKTVFITVSSDFNICPWQPNQREKSLEILSRRCYINLAQTHEYR